MGYGFKFECKNQACGYSEEVLDDYSGLLYQLTYECENCREFFIIEVDDDDNLIYRHKNMEFEKNGRFNVDEGASCPRCKTISKKRMHFEDAEAGKIWCPKCNTLMEKTDEFFYDD